MAPKAKLKRSIDAKQLGAGAITALSAGYQADLVRRQLTPGRCEFTPRLRKQESNPPKCCKSSK